MADSSTQAALTQNLDFPSLVARGENPKGFVARTPNGTAMDRGPGWNREPMWEMPQVPATGVWGEADVNIAGTLMPGRQGNRTGE